MSVVFFCVPLCKCSEKDIGVLESLGFRPPPQTRQFCPRPLRRPWPYNICVCTAGRAETVAQDTLRVLLEDGSVPSESITLCVKQDAGEVAAYEPLGLKISVAGAGLPEQRKACMAHLPEGSWCLFADDDLTAIHVMKQGVSTHQVIVWAFLTALERKVFLWGLNTSSNVKFLRENVSNQIGLCNGHFYGVVKCARVEEPQTTRLSDAVFGAAEDIERSVRMFVHCGGLVRVNWATAVAKHKQMGGLQDTFASKQVRQCAQDFVVRALSYEYPKHIEFAEDSPNRCRFIQNRTEPEYKMVRYSCQICDKTYARKASLDHHMNIAHAAQPQTFACPTCGRAFTSKKAMVLHTNMQRCDSKRGRYANKTLT